jgi:hypothetical protein
VIVAVVMAFVVAGGWWWCLDSASLPVMWQDHAPTFMSGPAMCGRIFAFRTTESKLVLTAVPPCVLVEANEEFGVFLRVNKRNLDVCRVQRFFAVFIVAVISHSMHHEIQLVIYRVLRVVSVLVRMQGTKLMNIQYPVVVAVVLVKLLRDAGVSPFSR